MNSIDSPNSNSRPLLVFNPDAKLSKEIRNIIQDFKPCTISQEEFDFGNDEGYDVENCYALFAEGRTTTIQDRQKGFIIGSIQEPCHDYVALWSSGSQGRGEFHKKALANGVPETLYGQDAPHFSTSQDISRFQEWVSHPFVEGAISDRFWHSYGNHLDGVDCLVFAQDLHPSLLTCIKEYESQGGYVDWSTNELQGLLSIVERQEQEKRVNSGGSNGENNDNNESTMPWEETLVIHHAPCEEYFDEILAAKIENGPEKVMYKRFGFTGCCKKDYLDIDPILFEWSNVIPKQSQNGGDNENKGSVIVWSMFATFTVLLMASIAQKIEKRRRRRSQAATIEHNVLTTENDFTSEINLQQVYID